MQNEITELRNQVRTLKRIVCLVCCLFGVLMFTGCTKSQPITWELHYNELTGEWERIPIYRQADNQIRKESDQERESSSSQITKENEVRKESDLEEDSGHGIFPGGTPGHGRIENPKDPNP